MTKREENVLDFSRQFEKLITGLGIGTILGIFTIETFPHWLVFFIGMIVGVDCWEYLRTKGYLPKNTSVPKTQDAPPSE